MTGMNCIYIVIEFPSTDVIYTPFKAKINTMHSDTLCIIFAEKDTVQIIPVLVPLNLNLIIMVPGNNYTITVTLIVLYAPFV